MTKQQRGTKMAKERLPRILEDWLTDTEQFWAAKSASPSGTLSDSHLLAEAEWCWYCMNTGECSGMWSDVYTHPATKAALKRYIDRLRARGVTPKRDFEIV